MRFKPRLKKESYSFSFAKWQFQAHSANARQRHKRLAPHTRIVRFLEVVANHKAVALWNHPALNMCTGRWNTIVPRATVHRQTPGFERDVLTRMIEFFDAERYKAARGGRAQ